MSAQISVPAAATQGGSCSTSHALQALKASVPHSIAQEGALHKRVNWAWQSHHASHKRNEAPLSPVGSVHPHGMFRTACAAQQQQLNFPGRSAPGHTSA